MKLFRSLAPLALAAALLAACGGGDPDVPGSGSPSGAPTTPGNFTAFISFGDSLSDVGTYSPAPAQFNIQGGKFTTNGPSGTVWVENVAATLGLPVTPAEVGFDGQSVKCPAALQSTVPAIQRSCTAYGQGGARVTNPNGIGRDPATGAGALTVPVVTQIANHLANPAFGGRFADTDLIMVYAGNNDVFVQFGAFAAQAAQIQAQAAAGQITVDQANALLFQAQTDAQEAMKQAAIELATLVRSEILAKGGKYVAVMTLSDIADTPFGNSSQVAPARTVLTDLSRIFNLWLREALTGQPVQIIDTFAMFKDLTARATALGFTNIALPACDIGKIATATANIITDGSSLFCDGNLLMTTPLQADANTWFFADSVHPSTGGHKAISDAFLAQLRAFGWI
ncbi:MAG: SGNH/GDSL hydrolase family protein [Piscinibacter sp.]|uniref:SGNH/GDSL hydrolase family protein n=1 Tax=Piscinibacter sp. TaxID=1903157 RepID=UPI003D0CFF12